MLFYTFLSVLFGGGGSLYSTLTLCLVIPKDSLLILLLCLFCLHESMCVSMSGTCGIKCNHNAIHSPGLELERGSVCSFTIRALIMLARESIQSLTEDPTY